MVTFFDGFRHKRAVFLHVALRLFFTVAWTMAKYVCVHVYEQDSFVSVCVCVCVSIPFATSIRFRCKHIAAQFIANVSHSMCEFSHCLSPHYHFILPIHRK